MVDECENDACIKFKYERKRGGWRVSTGLMIEYNLRFTTGQHDNYTKCMQRQ